MANLATDHPTQTTSSPEQIPTQSIVADSPSDVSIVRVGEDSHKLLIQEHYQHWWREPLAGIIAVVLACWDQWHYGRDQGFSSPLDELIVLTGIALIAGIRNLFPARRDESPPK